MAALKQDLRTSDGGPHLVESTRTMHVGAPGSAPRDDWKASRLGPNPPAGEVTLSFDRLFAGDLSGRARAFQSLVGGGMDPGRAAGLAGLMESE